MKRVGRGIISGIGCESNVELEVANNDLANTATEIPVSFQC